MKALTISQPFASLIADGRKWVENRRWSTNYRGPLAIHAGKGTQYLTRSQLADYPTGQIIAVADLVACVMIEQIRYTNQSSTLRKRRVPDTDRYWCEVARHKHTEGPYCWILQNVRRIEPIAINGRQGLWVPPIKLR